MEQFDILIKLRKILRSINLESKRIEKSHGISIPQLLALQYLKSQENYRSTSTNLKKHLNLNASTVTGILKRLEAKNMIVKIPDNADKRSMHVLLTAVGLEFLSNAPTTFQERITRSLSDMDLPTLQSLNRSIDLLIEIMNVDDMDAGQLLITGEIV
jgi:DNA-binding MarR family transcriptional regulator